ncbi:MAG: PAS domain-containing sensor histidine kinase [Bacteroidota bacterium]
MENKITDSQLMASLFAYATEGIILANRKGEIILVNPYGEKMFGYKKEELVGQKIEILIPKDLKKKHVGHREHFHQNPVNRSMGVGRDLFAQRKDGSTFPVEISLSHYTASDDEFVIAFIIDITIRKENEKNLREQKEELERVSKQIRQLNIDLERKVEDRTMMLRETLAQLEQSKDELAESLEKEKELSDLKTRFVSTVSHEFRTPLSTVLSSAALLSKYVTSEDQQKRDRHIVRIKESVKHLSGMLEDLLSLGKLEEGLIEAKLESFACEEFMKEFISEMQEIAKPEQKIKFSHSGSNQVVSDKRLLKNILNNLVSNAIKFSPEDAVIEIHCSNENDLVTLSVADKGIGISEEDRQHLFERFFRARNAFNIEGTGLGLHIVSKYVELLHGTIDLQSEIDKGSTFIISIPSKS